MLLLALNSQSVFDMFAVLACVPFLVSISSISCPIVWLEGMFERLRAKFLASVNQHCSMEVSEALLISTG